MAVDYLEFVFEKTDIKKWKEIVSKTIELAIRCGFKPSSINCYDDKSRDWTSLEDLIKEIESNFSEYKGHWIFVYGIFEYGSKGKPKHYSLDIDFSFYSAIGVKLYSDDSRWLRANKKEKRNFNKFLAELEKILGLKIIETEVDTEVQEKIKINKKGFII